ncbi:MAG TPA: basic amino acid ABC transporter substrate-binding protein [Bacillota bacterium]|jgi:polar amino acid transport system substrate-binding protein|nr:basic amino acid ABC transporter substrate-binding protein [Bacillota bacterium]HOB87601.1 basic amino acid ABC transporter substrate-binding protein [Bacillota bacterium]HOP69807.1 basic amino acid ABC transporter substrate-binding protein [Bacillota bacterium]HPT34027.1 basic amino acid ABC transporter substrate-binding protein [Bacillota bacterium]HPZ64887.1 basic amino acid ABC transporter substrate-binding protein [Bacillota bacterium]
MKLRFSVGLILVACLLAAGLLAGCGGGENVLVVGTNADFLPFEFYDDEGNIVGFDIDLAQAIAEILGMELRVEHMDFKGLVAAVQSGRVDVAIAAMTIDEERLEKVNFSDPYYNARQAIVVREDNDDIHDKEDLLDKKVAVQIGTTGDLTVTDMGLPEEQIVRLEKVTHVFLELENGQVDAVVIDLPVAQRYINIKEGLKLISGDFEDEMYGIAVAKENEELLEKINNALEQIKADGTLDKLMEKWID